MWNSQEITIDKNLLFLYFICSLLQACGGESPPHPPTPPEDVSYLLAPNNDKRDWLKAGELNSLTASKASPYHNSYFMPVGDEEAALHEFNGELAIKGVQLKGFPNNYDHAMKQFPTFNAHFVGDDRFLIPENRDIIIPEGSDSYWRIILSPGKVWSEAADAGMSRASFPFVMTESSWNTTFNGIATFLFNENNVSNLRVQLVQHTAPGFTDEAAGTVELTYLPTPTKSNTTIIENFKQELEQQLAVDSWQVLKERFPDIGWDKLNEGMAKEDVSASAIWFENTVYMKPCFTKYGDYPYCRFMRHGIYSATKSSAGAIALSYLSQRYGIEVLDYLIKDYLEISATHNGWEKVTFRDALSMATGIGNNDPNPRSSNVFADESGPLTGDWSRASSAQEKLDIAFIQYGNYPWQPGEFFRYNTNHTFVLSAAMDSLVRQRENIGLWELLKENVYRPIGIEHVPMMHTTESDGSRGVPILGVGLYPTVEDMVKIARLFHQHGEYNGTQLLHRETVKKALYRTDEVGLKSHVNDNEFGDGRYLMSFWSIPYEGETGCQLLVPFMAGAGGNYITILPNGVIGLRFTDSGIPDQRVLVDITSKLSPICQ